MATAVAMASRIPALTREYGVVDGQFFTGFMLPVPFELLIDWIANGRCWYCRTLGWPVRFHRPGDGWPEFWIMVNFSEWTVFWPVLNEAASRLPASTKRNGPVAQLAEHSTLNR